MTKSQTLKGVTVWVTRPEAQSASLAHKLEHIGAKVIQQPLLDIRWGDLSQSTKNQISQISPDTWLIFVSTNAVEGFNRILKSNKLPIPQGKYAAVGQKTAMALIEMGVEDVLFPSADASSEGLLALHELSDVSCEECFIVCGNQGRELIETTLIERGASVTSIDVYERKPITPKAFPNCDVVTITSNMALEAMMKVPELNKEVTLVTISERLQKLANKAGFKKTIISESPYEEDIIKAIKTNP